MIKYNWSLLNYSKAEYLVPAYLHNNHVIFKVRLWKLSPAYIMCDKLRSWLRLYQITHQSHYDFTQWDSCNSKDLKRFKNV